MKAFAFPFKSVFLHCIHSDYQHFKIFIKSKSCNKNLAWFPFYHRTNKVAENKFNKPKERSESHILAEFSHKNLSQSE